MTYGLNESVTRDILKRDETLTLHNEGEWSASESLFSAFNDAGVECEVGEFLYSLVRLIKPLNILETGTHHGIGASYLGKGLQDNGQGLLETIEFLEPNFSIAKKRMETLGLLDYVKCRFGDVRDFIPVTTYQLVFLDTEPQTRFAELIRFLPFLDEGGYIFIHDLHRHMHQVPNEEHGFAFPFGIVPNEMIELVTSGVLRPFHFTTPRGLTGFYRIAEGDYKW